MFRVSGFLSLGWVCPMLHSSLSMTESLKLPAQTPPTTPAVKAKPGAHQTIQAEALPQRLVERLQRMEQMSPTQAGVKFGSNSKGKTMGHEQEELWREYQRSLQQQAMIMEQERWQQVFEQQQLESYHLIVAHREILREQLQQIHQAAVTRQGSLAKGQGCKFDRGTLSGVVATLHQFVLRLLPQGTLRQEFLNCLQQAVLKYEGCDMAFHKDRLLQDVFDLLCDELLSLQKCAQRSATTSPLAGATTPTKSAASEPKWAVPVPTMEGASPHASSQEVSDRLEDIEDGVNGVEDGAKEADA